MQLGLCAKKQVRKNFQNAAKICVTSLGTEALWPRQNTPPLPGATLIVMDGKASIVRDRAIRSSCVLARKNWVRCLHRALYKLAQPIIPRARCATSSRIHRHRHLPPLQPQQPTVHRSPCIICTAPDARGLQSSVW